MTLTLNGSANTISGLAAGGLPAGSLTIRTIDLPSGTSLQTVTSAFGTSTVNITSDSWADTGHSGTITTLKANSKILVELTGGGWHDSGNGTSTAFITFERNFDGGSYSYATGAADGAHGLMRMSGDGENWNIGPYSCTLLDAPAQSAGTVIIYRVLAKKTNASGNTQYQASDRGLPTLTLTEVSV
jgi:hypothetical protein